MQKIRITQEELDEASGRFNEYMLYVKHRLPADVDPYTALFPAISRISKDGYKIEMGTFRDAAGRNVEAWLEDFFGQRGQLEYSLPPVAYRIDGAIYLLRMPVPRVEQIPLTFAVQGLTDSAAAAISSKKLALLSDDFNEFYDALYEMSELPPTTITHLRDAAQKIIQGPAFYSLARWETLFFIEKAMKGLLPGVKFKGATGHDVRGAVHAEWLAAGLPPLPTDLLDDVMCSTAARYINTPVPQETTLKAYYSAIRLGALISKNIAALDASGSETGIEIDQFKQDPVLSIARLEKALVAPASWSRVDLYR